MTGFRPKPSYDLSVFINCPFDADYLHLFRAVVFSVEMCGFQARCALEADDAGETRAEKLLRIIRGSRLGIHDISRTELNPEGLPRFNMPYEFGLFVGMKATGTGKHARKEVLVLDREKFRYQKFLSDIAGQDIRCHEGKANGVIREVRSWLASKIGRTLAGSDRLTTLYGKFLRDVPTILRATHRTAADLENFHDFHLLVCDWVEAQGEA